MRILDRYVLKSVLSLLFGCLFTFLFLYIIIDVFSHLEDILRQKIAIQLLLEYYLSYLPIIFVQVAPIACLLSVLYTFGRLNRNNEVIVMRASGLSIFQITRTVIMLGAIVSILVFWVNDKFVPHSLAVTEDIKTKIENSGRKRIEKENEIINNLSIYGMRNRLFFVNKFSLAQKSMDGIVILEHDDRQDITKKIVARRGVYEDGLWKFYQSITYTFDANGQIINEPQYLEEEIMAIPETPHDFSSQRQRPDYMTIAQLDDYIWKLSKSGANSVIRNLKVDLYQRYTVPLTSIIIIILGIPFSMIMKRRATGLSSVGISIMVGFLYYVLSAISIALGKSGTFPPILSASFSHIVALSTGLYLIARMP